MQTRRAVPAVSHPLITPTSYEPLSYLPTKYARLLRGVGNIIRRTPQDPCICSIGLPLTAAKGCPCCSTWETNHNIRRPRMREKTDDVRNALAPVSTPPYHIIVAKEQRLSPSFEPRISRVKLWKSQALSFLACSQFHPVPTLSRDTEATEPNMAWWNKTLDASSELPLLLLVRSTSSL